MALQVVIDPVAPEPASKPVVTLLHGFTQNAQCWGPFDAELAKAFRVERIDLPGHGGSLYDEADLVGAAELCLDASTGSVWVGYSLGGRIALHMALAAPQRCRALVVIGAHPGITDEIQRLERLRLDEERAIRVETIGTQAFVDEWLALPLFSGLDASTDHRQARYKNRAEGLAGSLRNCSTGRQAPLWDRLSSLAMPLLYVCGAQDTKFMQIGQDFTRCVGSNAQMANISDAGHSCHLEQPERTAAAVLDVLRPLRLAH